MKSTGVVRKIDELGRIVVPKEIRRSLNISDGEEVEIFVEEDSIILKKYYRLLTLQEVTKKYVEKMDKYLNCNVIITDREKVILSLKDQFRNLVGENISKNILEIINERKQVNEKGKITVTKNNFIEGYYLIIPIVVNAESIGSIICMTNETFSEKTVTVAEIISTLIKTHFED